MGESVCQEEVFRSVYEAQAEPLVNFIYYKSGDYSAAEDLMQDAFAKLWQECSKVSLEKTKSFLYTVVKNMFYNTVRHKKVVLRFEQRGHSQLSNETPQFLLEEAEFKQKLEAAISALPEGQREVFLMSRIEKMKYKEIAERLNLSVKAIEKRMHKALLTLRETCGSL